MFRTVVACVYMTFLTYVQRGHPPEYEFCLPVFCYLILRLLLTGVILGLGVVRRECDILYAYQYQFV
jgi:hypothetical protein